MYNETYIRDFDEQRDYIQTLRDPRRLEIVKNEYLNMYNGTSNTNYLAFKESLDHYVLKQIIKDNNYVKTQEFKNYLTYICNIGRNKTTKIRDGLDTVLEYNTNAVFRNKGARELIFRTYFNNETIRALNVIIDDNNKRVDYCRKLLESNKTLTREQLNYIAEYLNLSHDTSSDLYKNYIEYIFNKLDKNYQMSLQMTSAVLSYLPFVYKGDESIKNSRMYVGKYDSPTLTFKDIHIDTQVYETKENETLESIARKHRMSLKELTDLNPNSYKMYGTNKVIEKGRKIRIKQGNEIRMAHSKGQQKICAFDGELLKNVTLKDDSLNYSRTSTNNDIFFWIMCSFHELTHQHQANMMYKNELNTSGLSMIIRNALNRELCDYSKNHDSDEIEMEADENAWTNTLAFIQTHINFSRMSSQESKKERQGDISYYSKCRKNRDSVHARRIFSQKASIDNSLLLYYEYDLINLEKIAKKNPSIIGEYPMLRMIFKSNGEINPLFVFNQRVTTDDKNFMYGENYAGIEVGTYFFNYKMNTIINHMKNNPITKEQAENLKSNIWHVTHQNILKLREINKININDYKETHSKFDFRKIEEIKAIYFKNMMMGIYNMVRVNRIIGKIYPEIERMDVIKDCIERWFVETCKLCPNIDKAKMKRYMNNYDSTKDSELMILSNYAKKVFDLDKISLMDSSKNRKNSNTNYKSTPINNGNNNDELYSMFEDNSNYEDEYYNRRIA